MPLPQLGWALLEGVSERPPREVFLRERPRTQGPVETTRADAISKRFYSDTQVPGAAESLGGLARRQAGARGFYRKAKARVQKRDAWLQDFHWLIQIRHELMLGEFLAFHLDNKEGTVQGPSVFLIPFTFLLAGGQVAGCRYPDSRRSFRHLAS